MSIYSSTIQRLNSVRWHFLLLFLWPLYSSVITRSNSMSLSVHDSHLHCCVVAFIRFLIGQHIFTPQWFVFVCGWHPAHELVYLRTLSVWTGNRRLRERKKNWLFFKPPTHVSSAVSSAWSVAHLNRCVSTCCSNMALKATLRWCHRRSKVNMLQPNVLHPNVHS